MVKKKIKAWKALPAKKRQLVIDALRSSNKAELDRFDRDLEKAIRRHIVRVVVLPLHGSEQVCAGVTEAVEFVRNYDETQQITGFDRYEICIHYNNADRINGEFRNREDAIEFLQNYLPLAKLVLELPVRAGVKVIGGKPIARPAPEPKQSKSRGKK